MFSQQLISATPPTVQHRQITVMACDDLAERDLYTTAAILALELGVDIAPISWASCQIDVAIHGAAPAVA